MKVLVILGHPRRNSLCGALAAAYAEGARDGGAAVRTLDVGEMTFEPDVTGISPRDQPLEDSVRAAMAAIAWADHLVLVYPTWWGTMPAVLKAFLDRVLLPGFAFADRDDGEGWERLLTGKSAHLLTTMDTPPWVYRWIYKAPGANALGRATLGFCGVDPVRITLFGPVKESTPARRAHWLEQARREGRALRRGVVRGKALLLRRIAAWTAALRLQFHPMTLIAYTLGALAAAAHGIAPGPYWTGFACLFLLEVATVLSNDLFDLPSDRLNRHAGPFSGGSRGLVEGRVSL